MWVLGKLSVDMFCRRYFKLDIINIKTSVEQIGISQK